MPTEYPWYKVIKNSDSLEQGDILENWGVNKPQPNSGEVVVEYYTLILMTQTCDIEDGISHLVFCPVWTQIELAKAEPSFNKKETIGNLLKGRVVGFYPINKFDANSFQRPWRIIQFQRIIELDTDDVRNNSQLLVPRLRLLPPYRESLSQSFARFFMRVGLPVPVDIT
jgi:hypothetical protein